MFNKLSTKWLISIFITLLLLAVVVIITNNSKSTISRNRTFKSELTNFDTLKVTQIIIYPKMRGEDIVLSKSGEDWKVNVDGEKYKADPNTIKGMLATLLSLRASRIAANSKDQWEQFEVTDSAASRVQLMAGKKTIVDLYLGKFTYQQPKNTNPYNYQQQGKMTSYVRLAGEKEVYAVDGLIAMSFNRQADDFRDRTLIHADKGTWKQLTFSGPDKSFDLVKQGNGWIVDGIAADSAAVAKYLASIAWLSNPDFIEVSNITTDKPLYSLRIEGENLPSPIKIDAFPADTSNGYAITSSQNEGAFFSGKMNGLFSKIFISKEQFFPTQKAIKQ
jgi:hypothetical protein